MESNPSEQTEMTEEGLFKESHKGKIKDKYHFSEKLASGGFGIVYKAEDRKTGKKFAIKTIQKKKLKDFQTFVNEVKILQALVSIKSFKISLPLPFRTTQTSSSFTRFGSGTTSASWCWNFVKAVSSSTTSSRRNICLKNKPRSS